MLTETSRRFQRWLKIHAGGRKYHFIMAHPWEDSWVILFEPEEYVAYYKGVPMYSGTSKEDAMKYIELEASETRAKQAKQRNPAKKNDTGGFVRRLDKLENMMRRRPMY